MKLSEFMLLDAKQKSLTVLHQGVLVGKRDTTVCKVFLFHLGHFYVEMFCHKEKKSVEEFIIFQDTDILLPYIDDLLIDDLLN